MASPRISRLLSDDSRSVGAVVDDLSLDLSFGSLHRRELLSNRQMHSVGCEWVLVAMVGDRGKECKKACPEVVNAVNCEIGR